MMGREKKIAIYRTMNIVIRKPNKIHAGKIEKSMKEAWETSFLSLDDQNMER